MDDPLAALLLDSVQVDRAQLAQALVEYLGIDKNTGAIIPKPRFLNLEARRKLLAYLLGVKASSLLKGTGESVPAKLIPQHTGLPEGTVRPRLRELVEGRLISQTEAGEYYIAQHQIHLAIQQLAPFGAEEDARQKSSADNLEEGANWFILAFQAIPSDHDVATSGSYDQKVAWAVMSLFNDKKPAIVETIREHIRLNLGITPPSRQNTNRSLRSLHPKYLYREASGEGKSLVYAPKPGILDVFEGL